MTPWLKIALTALGGILLVVEFCLHRRNLREAKQFEPQISPLDGTADAVPPRHRAQECSAHAVIAAIIAICYINSRNFVFYSSVWWLHSVVSLYKAWVLDRGGEPKFLPSPPGLIDSK
jgi:hypothetical protein